MPTESTIERAVMRRVYRARIVRPFVHAAPAAALFLVTLYGIGREVWVARVIQNMPADTGSAISFFVQAFLGTELVVQALFVLLAAALVWGVRELRHIAPMPVLARS